MRRPARIATLLAALASAAAVASPLAADADTDAPDDNRPRAITYVDAPGYGQALETWKSVEDVNAWIGARFEYDTARAMRLSETQRQVDGRLPIHAPSEFFASPKGVCVDLTRFAVETLAKIAPGSQPRYVMIEFDPATIGGNTLRRHWIASFRRDGKLYFFADSRRPGHIAGPYDTLQAFVEDYARVRGRTIVAFSERATYERTARIARGK